MKIGILSMQKILNYGSFLQARSLKMQLEQRGHDVYFVDIVPGRQIVPPAQNAKKTRLLSKLDKYVFKRIENYLLFKKMQQIHIADYKQYLDTEKSMPVEEPFDLVIIGSDEVFNATTASSWGFSTQLFGEVENARRVVTYAASCGSTTFESAKQYGIVNDLRKAMQNLQHISVRDENTADFVEKILSQVPQRHIDPVFLSSYDELIPTKPKRKPYMLIYAYPNRICDEKEISAIKAYARAHNLQIISVGMQQRWCKHNIAASAHELLAYVKGAECVVTDTFHGTVFSIKYNKRFITFVRESNRNKLMGLLKQFALEERSVDCVADLSKIMDQEIDFDRTNELITREQQKAYEYLDMITQEEN